MMMEAHGEARRPPGSVVHGLPSKYLPNAQGSNHALLVARVIAMRRYISQ